MSFDQRAILERFAQAWATGNIDVLMTLVTDDCVYDASVGPNPGRTYQGQSEVREGFKAMVQYDAGGTSDERCVMVQGDYALTEWWYESRLPQGGTRRVRGCDIFQFRGDKICRKDAFRKCTP